MPRRILVTGGTGFIGSALVRRWVDTGAQVFVLARSGGDRSRLAAVKERIHMVVGDVRDAEAVRRAVDTAAPEVLYHLASTSFNPPTSSPQEHIQTIVMGAAHVLQAAAGRPGVRVIATGSAAEYGSGRNLREDAPLRPATLLGAAKASATVLFQTYARLRQLSTVVLRLFMPYGPGEAPHRVVPHVIRSAMAGREVPLTSGEQERDFVYLDDVVDALCLAAARPVAAGTVFNIGSGQATRVRGVIERLLELLGRSGTARFGAVPMRSDEIMEMSADISRAKQELGWEPRTSLEEGLRKTIAWFAEHPEGGRVSGGHATEPAPAGSRA